MSNKNLLLLCRRLHTVWSSRFPALQYQSKDSILRRSPTAYVGKCYAPTLTSLFLHNDSKSSSTDVRTGERASIDNVEDRELDQEDWTNLKTEYQSEDKWGHVDFNSYLLFTVKAYLKQSKHKRAKSLLDHARMELGTLPQMLFNMYCRYCAKDNDQDGVQWCMGAIRNEPSLIDTGNIRSLMSGVCLREEWKTEALDLLAMGMGNTKASTGFFEPLLRVASRHKDINLVSQLIDDMRDKHIVPTLAASASIIDNLQCNSGDESVDARCQELIFRLLGLFRRERHYISQQVASSLSSWFSSIPGSPWEYSFTRISNDGKCKSCGHQLEKMLLTSSEFKTLRKEVTEKVIFGADIYQKTRPDEFEAFTHFVKEGGPYDIVVDGLNVAHLVREMQPSVMLRQVIVYLVQVCGYKVLVLGRQHMRQSRGIWKRRNMDAVIDLADCFFTENISQDDPFMLYATLHSGPQCMYLTRDLLRDHKALLDPATHFSFIKWQQTHQMHPVNFLYNKLICKVIRKHDTVVQSAPTGWHIPYDKEDKARYSYQVPINWLCVTRR